mmetsp:Transcript_10549/g.29115  ORF Transcript_10549/g.29115 Transcript_10549/m.29115 type:complete len:667 (-) Transcript_10549:48-2048(-)
MAAETKRPKTNATVKKRSGSSSSSPHRKKSKHSSPSSSSNKNKATSKTTNSQTINKKPRKHSDIVEQAKVLWNQLRQKKLSKEQTTELMAELMPLIQGKAKEIALQHDAARVVQAAVQFGNAAQRRSLTEELTAEAGTLPELSKSQYAHFVVLKLIQYCCGDKCSADPECVTMILKNFSGHVPKLAVHAVGSRVVEALFTTVQSARKLAPLKLELYGPHMTLFATSLISNDNNSNNKKPYQPLTLSHCLQQAPEHKESTLDFVRNLLYKGMEKTLYALETFQQLLAEYCDVAVDDKNGALIRQLLAAQQSSTTTAGNPCEHAIHLLSTRAGVRAVCLFVAFGTAKDRKTILKSLKGYTQSGLTHPQAYLVFLQLARFTDDTVLLQKQMLQDILVQKPNDTDKKSDDQEATEEEESPLLELALSEKANKLLSFVLLMHESKDITQNKSKSNVALSKLLDPYEQSVLLLSYDDQVDGYPTIVADKEGNRTPTSKKNVQLKQKELLKSLQQPLLDLCQKHTEQLLTSRCGSALVRHVYKFILAHTTTATTIQSLVDSILQVCQNDNNALLGDSVGHWAIKNLILADEGLDKENVTFSKAFLETYRSNLTGIALSHGNRSAFVVAALVQVLSKKAVAKHLKTPQLKSELSKTSSSSQAGLKALLKELGQE